MLSLRRIISNTISHQPSSSSSNNKLFNKTSFNRIITAQFNNNNNNNNNTITSINSTISNLPNINYIHTIQTRTFKSSIVARFAHSVASEGPKEYVPITFVDTVGNRRLVSAQVGLTLLEVAKIYDIDILGLCKGGGLPESMYGEGPACRTCHVWIDDDHLNFLPEKEPLEVAETYYIHNANKNSRFACELIITKQFKGMTVVIPDDPRLGSDFKGNTFDRVLNS